MAHNTFYSRYESLCDDRDINPCGNAIATDLRISKATISAWKSAGNIPSGDLVKRVADRFAVSGDYLLGRTADPTDYTVGKRASLPETLRRKLELLGDLDQIKVEAYIDGLLSRSRDENADGKPEHA